MSVDLEKLIARKSYLVPFKASDLCEKILEQLKVTGPWKISSKHPNSGVFGIDYSIRYALFVLVDQEKEITPEEIEKKKTEFQKNPSKGISLVQKETVNEEPNELNYIVIEERPDSCIVKATCKPILYHKIIRHVEHPESNPQDVRIRNEEFLDEIFIGGLGGKEIQERKESSRWELLINDVNNRQITERIYEMLRDATTCVLLIGWVGTDCLPKLKELKNAGVTIRSVTHKPSELKAPVPADIQKGYAELVELISLNNISVNPLLHGRALIVDNKALIGSMDFNSHSLSGEHVEFAIYTEDVDTVRSLRSYFEEMFKPLKEAEK